MHSSGPSAIGGYRLVKLIGEGGMGQVWLAEHPRLPRQVAVKVLRPGMADDQGGRARFLREAETAARLEHPGIVDVLDRGEDEGRLWIAMRFIDGEDLGDRLAREGRLNERDTLVIAGSVAEALDHAHERGVVHRDVKPANILLPRSGRPAAVVTDFGIARALDDGRAMTGTGMVIGSMPYISPEQIDGAPSTPSSDLYAFACAVYEMLTGQRAFNGPTTSAVIGAHVATQRPSVRRQRPDLPAAVDAVLQRALAIDPAARWATAGAFVSALTQSLSADTATAATQVRRTSGAPTATAPIRSNTTPLMPASTTAPARRTVVPWVAAGVALVAALSAVGWMVLGRGAEPEHAAAVTSSSTTVSTATSFSSSAPGSTNTTVPVASTSTTTSPPTSSTSSTRASGDLGLTTAISTPACDGRGVILLYNAVTNDRTAQARQIKGALEKWPSASYMKPDPACTSLRSVKDGEQIYAVYLDAGGPLSEEQLCTALLPYATSAGSSPYAKYLDNSHPQGHFYRWNAARTQCFYIADASGEGRRQVV